MPDPKYGWLQAIIDRSRASSPAASDATRVAKQPARQQLPSRVLSEYPKRDVTDLMPAGVGSAAKALRFLAKSSAESGESVAHNLNKGIGYARAGDLKSAALPIGLAIGETVLNLTGGEGAEKAGAEKLVAVASRHGKTKRVFAGPIHVLAEGEGQAAGLSGHFEHGFIASDGVNMRFVDRSEAQAIGRRQRRKGAASLGWRSEDYRPGQLDPNINGEITHLMGNNIARRQAMFHQLHAENPSWSVKQIAEEIRRRETAPVAKQVERRSLTDENNEARRRFAELAGDAKSLSDDRRREIIAALRDDPIPMQARRLFDAIKGRNGFSIDPLTGQSVTSGFAVGAGDKLGKLLKHPVDQLSPDVIAKYLRENKLPKNTILGGWVDNGHVYIEPSTLVKSRASAMKLGRERGEKAIGDLAKYANNEDGTILLPKVVPPSRALTPVMKAARDPRSAVNARVNNALRVLEEPLPSADQYAPQLRILDPKLIKLDEGVTPGALPVREAFGPKQARGHMQGLHSDENMDLIRRQVLRGDRMVNPHTGNSVMREFYPSYASVDDIIGNSGGDPVLFRKALSAAAIRNGVPTEINIGSLLHWAMKDGGVFDIDELNRLYRLAPTERKEAFAKLAKEIRDAGARHAPDAQGFQLLPVHPQSFAGLLNDEFSAYKIPWYDKQKVADIAGNVLDTHEATGGTLASPFHHLFAAQGGFKTAGEYGAHEAALDNLWKDMGLSSRTGQALRWGGGGGITGLRTPPTANYAQLFEQSLLENARHRNIDPLDLVKRIARGNTFLYTPR